MDHLTLYDYLAFVLPGAVVIAAATYGYQGWPWSAPSASVLIIFTAAAFVVGYLVAGIANLAEGAFLGGRPGSSPDPLWGTLGADSKFTEEEKDFYAKNLRARYGAELPLKVSYRQGATELRRLDAAPMLAVTNQQMGFARGMAVASAIAVVAIITCAALGRDHLEPWFWVPVALVACFVFVMRFRRFWRWYGMAVLRGVADLQREAMPPAN